VPRARSSCCSAPTATSISGAHGAAARPTAARSRASLRPAASRSLMAALAL